MLNKRKRGKDIHVPSKPVQTIDLGNMKLTSIANFRKNMQMFARKWSSFNLWRKDDDCLIGLE